MLTTIIDEQLIDVDESDIKDFLFDMRKVMHKGQKIGEDYRLAIDDLFSTYDLTKLCAEIVENDDDFKDWAREHMLED